jgi:hypothetical protein
MKNLRDNILEGLFEKDTVSKISKSLEWPKLIQDVNMVDWDEDDIDRFGPKIRANLEYNLFQLFKQNKKSHSIVIYRQKSPKSFKCKEENLVFETASDTIKEAFNDTVYFKFSDSTFKKSKFGLYVWWLDEYTLGISYALDGKDDPPYWIIRFSKNSPTKIMDSSDNYIDFPSDFIKIDCKKNYKEFNIEELCQ